jgi:hypothetical protein
MLTSDRLKFILSITDYFHGHWEDPGWGQKPMNQVLVLLSTHTLAEGIADDEVRRQVQGTIEGAIAEAAQRSVRSSS